MNRLLLFFVLNIICSTDVLCQCKFGVSNWGLLTANFWAFFVASHVPAYNSRALIVSLLQSWIFV